MDEPLLQNGGVEAVYVKKTSLFVSSVKWVLKFVMCVVFVAWIAFIFVYPSELGTQLFEIWIKATTGTVFGVTGWKFKLLALCISSFFIVVLLVVSSLILCNIAGSIFLIFSGPVLVIAFLSIMHLTLSGEEDLPRFVIL